VSRVVVPLIYILTLPLKFGSPLASAYHAMSLRLLSLIHIRPLNMYVF
jgi:hypothetical protein